MSFAYVEDKQEESLSLLKRLCSQPSIAAVGEGIDGMATLLREELQDIGCDVEIFETEGSPVVLAEVKGKQDNTLMFYNHYDVQPPEPLDEWDSPPFDPAICDGKFYARGVSDNKGNIAARIWAVKSLLATESELPLNVKFLIEGEEEIGSPHFASFVENNAEKLQANGCIWESGYKNEDNQLRISLGLKGIYYTELIAHGPKHDLHSSLGTIVPNAAWKLVKAFATIKDRKDEVQIEGFYENVQSPTTEELEAIKKIPFKEEMKKKRFGIESFLNDLTGEALKKKHLLQPACNICGLRSGWVNEGAKTVLPAKAVGKLGFRLVPNQDPDKLEEKLRSHLDEHGFEDVSLNKLAGEKPARTPVTDPFVEQVVKAAQSVYERDPVVYPTSAGSGPMYPIRSLDIPVAGAGVGYYDSKNHAPNENIRVDDYIAGIKHIIQIIKTF